MPSCFAVFRLTASERTNQGRKHLRLAVPVAIRDAERPTVDMPQVAHTFEQLLYVAAGILRGSDAQHRDKRWALRQRTLARRAESEKREHGVAAVHSITLSAWNCSVFGMATPSARAVFMLIVRSNRLGCSIGNSAGLAPFRTLST